jgi:hypothetical protein
MEILAAIHEGMASAERGELKAAAQVLAEMQVRYGLSLVLPPLRKLTYTRPKRRRGIRERQK